MSYPRRSVGLYSQTLQLHFTHQMHRACSSTCFALALVSAILMSSYVHGVESFCLTPDDACEITAVKADAGMAHGCCDSRASDAPCDAASETPTEREPQKPSDPCDGPCDCPCCIKSLVQGPMIVGLLSTIPRDDSRCLLVILPHPRPERVALSVAVQPPIA